MLELCKPDYTRERKEEGVAASDQGGATRKRQMCCSNGSFVHLEHLAFESEDIATNERAPARAGGNVYESKYDSPGILNGLRLRRVAVRLGWPR